MLKQQLILGVTDKIKYHAWSRTPYGKVTKNTNKHHTQESQEVSPFPASDHKAARNTQDSKTKINKNTNNKSIHKRHTFLEQSVKKYLSA